MRDIQYYRHRLAQANTHTQSESLPQNVAEWLMHKGSLTEKLQTVCPNLTIEVISEGWQAVNFSENSAKQWVREVIIQCGQTDWIFAQTVLPEQTIAQVAQKVPHLGSEPIGLWLFPQRPQRLSLQWQYDPVQQLAVRCSRLSLKGYPIDIKELFLNNFPFGA